MKYEDFTKEIDKRVEDVRFHDDNMTEIAKAYNAGLDTVACYAKTVFLQLQSKEREQNV